MRLPVNRGPRTDDNPFLDAHILPDESYVLVPGTHTVSKQVVTVSKRLSRVEMNTIKGQGSTQRAMPNDEVTLNVLQWRDKEGQPQVVERFSLLNVTIPGQLHLEASGITFGPLLIDVLRNAYGGVPFDIIYHVAIQRSRDKSENKVLPVSPPRSHKEVVG